MDYDKFINDNQVDLRTLLKMIVHVETGAVIYFKDEKSRIQYVNDQFFLKHKDFKGNREAVIGKTDFDLFPQNEHALQAFNDEQRVMKTGQPIHIIETEGTNERGHTIIVRTQKYPLYNQEGKVIGIFGITEDITADIEAVQSIDHENDILTKLNMQLTKENTTDALSGIHNRRFLRAELDSLYTEFYQNNTPFCILSIDIDDYKHINDNYGHETGDRVIRFIGKSLLKLKSQYYPMMEMCRQGGDEFMIIMPNTTKQQAIMAAYKIQEYFRSERFIFENFNESISMSMGLSEIREGDTVRMLLERADHRLYNVKRHGKNGLCYKGEYKQNKVE